MASRVRWSFARVVTGLGTGCLVFGLVWLTVSLLKSGSDGAGIANVLALPVSMLSLLAGVAAFVVGRKLQSTADDPAELAHWAQVLLRQVTAAEERALQQLLGDTGHPRPADVGFVQPEAAMLRWRTDGGGPDGSLETIASYYKDLGLGRLVVLGEAGAGKTVLALRLLLDLAKTAATGLDPGARVPVRLSLPAFPLVGGTEDAGVARARLDVWIARHLTAVYGIKPAVATALVTAGRVLPILDGLDEMDPDDEPPERARLVLAALNYAAGPGWPVVLTCRTTRYDELVQPPARAGGPLQDVTVVVVQPLGVGQVIAWLAHRFPEPDQPDGLQRRWRRVATTLRNHPTGRLADCLTSPLYLYLAAAVYQDSDTKPRELCDLARPVLQQHLLEHVIPALVQHYPRPDHTYYDPDRVRRWLQTLADHLAHMATLNYSSADIHLHELWRTTGHPPGRRIRHHATALSTGLITLPLLGLIPFDLVTSSFQSMAGPAWALVAVLLLPVGGAAIVINSPNMEMETEKLDFGRFRTSEARRHFAGQFGLGLAFGLAAMLLAWLSDKFEEGLVLVVFGLPAGLPFGLTGWLSGELALGLALGLAFGLAYGLMYSFWPRYTLTVRSLRRTDHLPRQLGQFLDWAYTAGLVRLAGTATQFRHRDLQTHLTSTDNTTPIDTTRTSPNQTNGDTQHPAT